MRVWEVFANSLPANITLPLVGWRLAAGENPLDPETMLTIEEIKPANIGEIRPEFGNWA
jgi:hypothetical protein